MLRIRGEHRSTRPDTVAAEEPLEIRLRGRPLAVTMRTPGHDFDLVHGFLQTEGVIAGLEDVAGLRYCEGVDDEGRNTYNVVDVDLADGVEPPDTALDRNFYTSSSCGVCGKASIDAIRTRTRYDVAGDALRLPLATLLALPDRLRAAQEVFDKTGGLHAAGLFTAEGEDARRLAARIERTVGALADEWSTDWWSARRRAATGATPALTGPSGGAWRRAWALDADASRRNGRRAWP